MTIAIICGIVLGVLLEVDLLTKALAAAFLKNAAAVPIIPGLISLGYTENRGIAFGMFGDTEAAKPIIIVLTALMIVGIGVLFFTVLRKNTPARVCLTVIEAGAIGNLIDRVCLGYVRDFVDVSRIGFGICNIADFFITFGAVALVIVILFIGKDALIPLGKYKRAHEAEKAEEERETERDGT